MSIVAEPLTVYLVEWYRPGLDGDQLSDLVADLDRSSISVTAEGSAVRCVYTLVVPADEVAFGVFVADSAEVVALVCRRAGLPVTRLTAAVADCNRGPYA
jgi:hypothetical protein